MAVLVVGSVAFDSVKTPFGEAKEVLGGSATYSSYAASFFCPAHLVGVVGTDFPAEYLNLLKKKSIDVNGLQVKKGKTFRWEGSYDYDLNTAKTISTSLNVFKNFHPRIPKEYQKLKYVFLANIDPELQLEVLKQVKNPELVIGDTMNFWIENKRDVLLEVIKKLDVVILNDAETRELTKETNLVKAGRKLLSSGPSYIIIKKGEHGAILLSNSAYFATPAYPLESIYDPTGAGDAFAGGFLGYLAGLKKIDDGQLKKAVVYGSVIASFNVEDFSLNRLGRLTREEITRRYIEFVAISHFENFSI